jgi:P-type E1-E2 ATPase
MSHDLVPGDIVIPQLGEEICFDGIVITGEVFLNEASLTGESVPVGKFPAENVEKAKLDNRWLFEGGKVL